MQECLTKSWRVAVRVVAGAMVIQTGFGRPSAAQVPPAIDEGAQVLAQRAAAGTWDTFTARVTIRRQWVSDAGTPVGPPAPEHEYLWERELTARGWANRMTVVDRSGPVVRTRQGDQALSAASIAEKAIARMEDREDGSAPRFFNRAGVELRPSWRPTSSNAPRGGDAAVAGPGGEAAIGGRGGESAIGGIDAALLAPAAGSGPRPSSGREWVQGFVMPPGRSSTRLQSVTKGYGRRAGWVRGYGQYVRDDGRRRLELLVDEQDGVPMEANVVEDGALRSHTTFRYERSISGALVRRGVRVEVATPPSSTSGPVPGARVVTDVTYSQVRLLTKGGR